MVPFQNLNLQEAEMGDLRSKYVKEGLMSQLKLKSITMPRNKTQQNVGYKQVC